MKDILIMAYHFPPAQNGAVARFYSFYRHLHKYGFNPVIVTIDNFGAMDGEKNVYRFKSLAEVKRKPIYKRFLLKKTKKLIYDKFDTTFDFRWRRHVKKNMDDIVKLYDFKAVLASFPHSESMCLGMYISKNTVYP